jgi:hypothetical protein
MVQLLITNSFESYKENSMYVAAVRKMIQCTVTILITHVEAGPNTSTVTVQVIRGDEME